MGDVGKVKTLNPTLFVRRCVACGYDGALLRGGAAGRCARCGCDLLHRPARSYAEMEGLVGRPDPVDTPLVPRLAQHTIIQRWLAFLFMLALGMLGLIALADAAMP